MVTYSGRVMLYKTCDSQLLQLLQALSTTEIIASHLFS